MAEQQLDGAHIGTTFQQMRGEGVPQRRRRDGLLTPAALAPPLTLANCGISTSGDLEQSLLIDGQRQSHIINPRHGLGLTQRIAVTVIAADATASDAFATAACVMGAERAFTMIDDIDGAAARLVTLDDLTPRAQQSARFPR